MKQKLVSLVLAVFMLLSGLAGLTSCNNDSSESTPQKLQAPVVTLTDNVASWGAVSNAEKYEISLDGSLSYVENTVTFKTLTDGQTIKVRAIGDGITYSTSDWSNAVTYNVPAQETDISTEIITEEPTEIPTETPTDTPTETSTETDPEPPTETTTETTTETPTEIPTETPTESTTEPSVNPPVEPDTKEPQYLGIFVSSNEPSQADGLPGAFAFRTRMMSYRMMRAGSYRSLGTALDEYFADSNNHLGATIPTAADYEIFSRAGETVYIQIWLNNPNQHTILSLKLNGTKYQVGGGLSSFFIEDNGQRYNCIYVAVTIPNGAYTEKTYTVTDIEYIADTYINADGTDEFMNNNDTVSIGLPYNAQNPTVSDFNPTSLTVNSCSVTLTLMDADGLANLSGGWLGIAVYDGYNIVANQSVAIGSNTVSATGLVENSTYWVIVYLYVDLHDGNGVSAHTLFEQAIQTPEAITVDEVSGTLLYDSVKDGYYGAIKVKTTLNSNNGGSTFELPAIGTQVRVKLIADGYWLDSEWSDWYTFEGIKVAAPTLGEYSTDDCTISWSLDDSTNISHYVYTINGGAEITVALNGNLSVDLSNGDIFRVKCVASEEGFANGYIDSAWVTYTCTDNRASLSVPSNVRIENGELVWDAVDGASYYIVEQTYNGRTVELTAYSTNNYVKSGATYRVRAVSEDTENYKPSAWSDSFIYTVTLDAPAFSQIRRERVYWTSVDYAQGYNYKIGENGEVNTSRNYYLALSEIPVGEKLYVQAYAEDCISSEWVMIYHNVTKLATPNVTVSGGTASWSAIEGAEGYLYKINGGEETATTELSVSGLEAGDVITVCATINAFGYANSDWSEEKIQLPTMSAPMLDISLLSSEGRISWSAVDGASFYEYDLCDGINTLDELSLSDIQYGQSFRVRAVCDNGEYEQFGEWSEIVVREDTREQLTTPTIAYDPEIGLTAVINDTRVSYFEIRFGKDGLTNIYYLPDGAFETEVIATSFIFPENDYTVYVRAVPHDDSYRESEWAMLTISFE